MATIGRRPGGVEVPTTAQFRQSTDDSLQLASLRWRRHPLVEVPMKLPGMLLATLALVGLAGCAHVNHVGLQTKSFAISAGKTGSKKTASARPAGGPPHCPPGHARKGEC